jgi:electron transport complex protein RnfB
MSRKEFLKAGAGLALGLGIGASAAAAALKSMKAGKVTDTVWQIDPYACVRCGTCSKTCVLSPSAVKCVHAFDVCGYCDLCSGFFRQNARNLSTGAENELCPTGAIRRSYIEDPYFEYTIDEALCIGCARCVKGCSAFGNGSLFLQIRHDRCVNCNECACARNCPSGAIKRVGRASPYLLKKGKTNA